MHHTREKRVHQGECKGKNTVNPLCLRERGEQKKKIETRRKVRAQDQISER